MALRRPLVELEGIATLREAQLFYARLGRYLSGAAPKGGQTWKAYQEKPWRAEAIEARRLLEERFGNAVRLTSSTPYATAAAGGGRGRWGKSALTPDAEAGGAARIMPTWAQRSHFTVNKPSPTEISDPYILFIPLDDWTMEPLGVYHLPGPESTERKGTETSSPLFKALNKIGQVRSSRQHIGRRTSYETARGVRLREALDHVEKMIKVYKRELEWLERERKRLKEDVES